MKTLALLLAALPVALALHAYAIYPIVLRIAAAFRPPPPVPPDPAE